MKERGRAHYRSKMRILVDIMQTIKEEEKRGGAKLTRILYGANLSHDRLVRYMDELTEKGLITEHGSGDYLVYHLSDRGAAFMLEFDKVEKFMDAFGLSI
jgi:predicted transcriptional regulator